MTEAFDMAVRLRAIAAAQGKEPFDLLIAGGACSMSQPWNCARPMWASSAR